MLAWTLGICSAALGAPAMEGRDLHGLVDPAFEGDGPGGALFVEARELGSDSASLGGTAMAGWTFRPLRIAVALPAEAGTDHWKGLQPRFDARFVLSDRRRVPLGVAAGLDVPLTFFPGETRPAFGRLSLGVGAEHTAFVLNLGAPIGPELTWVRWGLGASAPLVSVLTGFAEAEGTVPFRVDGPRMGTPRLATLRVGLRLSPIKPVVVGFAVEGHPDDPGPTLAGSLAWIPQPRGHWTNDRRLARLRERQAAEPTPGTSPPADETR